MNIRKAFVLSAGASVLLALAYVVAHAASLGNQPVGSTLRCGRGLFNCNVNILTSTGPANFVTNNAPTPPTFTVASSTPGGEGVAASTSLTPQAWQGTGTSPTLGAVRWQFDVSRSVENTTVTANQTGADFPATAHIRFHVTGTIAAYPGVTFESATPLDVTGTVNSFDPFVNETFRLAAPVQFRDANNPQGQTFTMNTLTLTLSR